MNDESTATSSSSTHYFSIFTNYPLISAVTSFTIAQFIKLFTSWYRERRWDLKQLIGSGGMPSSPCSYWFARGLWWIAFCHCFGFGICCDVYDATGVRLHAGRQAEVLIRLYTNFLQNIRWLKADLCGNFSVIPLPRSLLVECLEVPQQSLDTYFSG